MSCFLLLLMILENNLLIYMSTTENCSYTVSFQLKFYMQSNLKNHVGISITVLKC